MSVTEPRRWEEESRRVSDPSPKSVWSQNLPLSSYFLNSITPEPVVKCMERVQ